MPASCLHSGGFATREAPSSIQRSAAKMCAWILPSTGPGPNWRSMAAAARSVASSRRDLSRASISLRNGVPWQYATAGIRGDVAVLRSATVCTSGASKPPSPPAKWQAYAIQFSGVLTFQGTELDTWESLQGGRFPETSFDEIIDSPWIASMAGKIRPQHRHFVLQTYDRVFEIVCTSYDLQLKQLRA